MELRTLRYFVALAEHLNFTAAARSLGVKPAPLRVHIRNLETEMGGPLFSRGRRRILLTPLGLLLLDEARQLLRQAEETTLRIRDAAEGREGKIRVGFTQGALSEKVTKRLRKFLRKYRGVRLDFSEVPYGQGEAHALSGFDVLLTECLAPTQSVIVERSVLSVAVSPKHRLADHSSLQPTDLIGELLLLAPPEKRSPAECYITKLVDSQTFALTVSCVYEEFLTRLWHVSLGNGVSVCSSADRPLLDAVLVPLADAPEILTTATSNPSSRSTALPVLLEAIQG